MITASKRFIFFIAIALLTACDSGNVKYETYHNHFYDYTVEYPDFLIPQGEATNRDGQKFVSADLSIQMLLYRDYKNDFLTGGDLYSIDEAYEQELKSIEGVFNKKLGDTHYIIESKKDDTLHTVYVGFYDVNYFNFRFEYSEKDKKMMPSIINHVIESLRIGVQEGIFWPAGNGSVGEAENRFTAFLEGFLNDSYWGKTSILCCVTKTKL